MPTKKELAEDICARLAQEYDKLSYKDLVETRSELNYLLKLKNED